MTNRSPKNSETDIPHDKIAMYTEFLRRMDKQREGDGPVEIHGWADVIENMRETGFRIDRTLDGIEPKLEDFESAMQDNPDNVH